MPAGGKHSGVALAAGFPRRAGAAAPGSAAQGLRSLQMPRPLRLRGGYASPEVFATVCGLGRPVNPGPISYGVNVEFVFEGCETN